ncbi:MAG: site-specific DNA-methyltransferase [Thermoguttaceae bacterium]
MEQLRELFPDVFSEGKVDVEKLRAALGDIADDRPERYSFTWAGKRDAIRLLQTPSRATLVPAPDESVNFDSTQNLFIEGDNLEVLKLLYKSYSGRVKMIYIDPPYNTGNDFIYPDNFADPLDTYLRLTGQKAENGDLLTSNPETSGRYHSAWLSMMYPRLFVARQLLTEDGIIFVSIDDHELADLRLFLNEIFGEENFLATFVRKRRMATGMRGEPVSPDHEYVVAFARSLDRVRLFGNPKNEADYPFEDPKGKFRSTDLTVGMTKDMRPNQWYAIKNARTKIDYWPPEGRVWRFQPSTMQSHIHDDNIIWPDDRPGGNLSRPRFKTRFEPDGQLDSTTPVSTWIDYRKNGNGNGEEDDRVSLLAGMNQEATKELRELFGEQVLEYPKPISLMEALVSLATRANDLVLDFFAGSCSIAHAVLNANRVQGDGRQFVMVQLPEATEEESTARKAGYGTIAEIGKERIRRVIKKMKKEAKGRLDLGDREKPEDLGFRVFKLAESHFRRWSGTENKDPKEWLKQMELFIDPLLPNWDTLNVIQEVALKEGYSLTSRIEQLPAKAVKNNTIYRVTDVDRGQSFLICLDDKLKAATAKALDLKENDIFICRDVALTDELAANLALNCRLKTI